MKILITEMACNWNRLSTELQNKTLVRVEHMLKLLFYSDIRPYDIAGWCRSVANSCPSYILRTGKRLQWPNADKYFKVLWDPVQECDMPGHMIDKYISDFQYLGYPQIISCNKSRVKQYLRDFCFRISAVSCCSEISARQVNDIFTELSRYRNSFEGKVI